MKKLILTLSAIGLTAIFAGCSGGDERNHPLFRKGENAQKAGNAAEAVGFYKDLLKRRGGCKYVHLKLAEIYDESLKDPQMAALHYRLYLEAIPDAPDAEEVKAWQKNAEKRYYESLQSKFADKDESAVQKTSSAEAGSAPEKTEDKLAVTDAASTETARSEVNEQAVSGNTVDADELKKLREDLAESQNKLAQFRARYRFMQIELNRLRNIEREFKTQSSMQKNIRTYRVQQGDNLGSIALKCYGKSSLYYLIERANPGIDRNKLRAGMVLIIPEYQP